MRRPDTGELQRSSTSLAPAAAAAAPVLAHPDPAPEPVPELLSDTTRRCLACRARMPLCVCCLPPQNTGLHCARGFAHVVILAPYAEVAAALPNVMTVSITGAHAAHAAQGTLWVWTSVGTYRALVGLVGGGRVGHLQTAVGCSGWVCVETCFGAKRRVRATSIMMRETELWTSRQDISSYEPREAISSSW